jgi:hypothetical protein
MRVNYYFDDFTKVDRNIAEDILKQIALNLQTRTETQRFF